MAQLLVATADADATRRDKAHATAASLAHDAATRALLDATATRQLDASKQQQALAQQSSGVAVRLATTKKAPKKIKIDLN